MRSRYLGETPFIPVRERGVLGTDDDDDDGDGDSTGVLWRGHLVAHSVALTLIRILPRWKTPTR